MGRDHPLVPSDRLLPHQAQQGQLDALFEWFAAGEVDPAGLLREPAGEHRSGAAFGNCDGTDAAPRTIPLVWQPLDSATACPIKIERL